MKWILDFETFLFHHLCFQAATFALRTRPTDGQLFLQLCNDFLPALITSSQLIVYSTSTECDRRHGYTTARRRGYAESLCQQVYADLVELIQRVKKGEDSEICDALAREQEEQEELCDVLSRYYDVIRPEEEKVRMNFFFLSGKTWSTIKISSDMVTQCEGLFHVQRSMDISVHFGSIILVFWLMQRWTCASFFLIFVLGQSLCGTERPSASSSGDRRPMHGESSSAGSLRSAGGRTQELKISRFRNKYPHFKFNENLNQSRSPFRKRTSSFFIFTFCELNGYLFFFFPGLKH